MVEPVRTSTVATPPPPPLSTAEQQALQQFVQTTVVSYLTDGAAESDVPLLDAPIMSPDDAIALLMSLNAKLSNESTQSAIEGVEANRQKQEAAREEQLKKLMEAAQEIAKAAEGNVLAQVFGWIGVALAVVAAVAVSVATFGAAAPASGLAIAGVVAAVMGAVLAGTTQIVSSIPGAMDSMGKEGSQAFMFTMMALQIVAAIFSVGAGAASAASAGTTTGTAAAKGATNVADVATDVADVSTDVAQVAAKATKIEIAAERASKAAQIGSGITEVAAGGNEIATAQHQADAEYAKADAAEVAKWLKQLAAQDENAVEFIRALQEIADKGWQIVVSVVKESNDLQQSLTQRFQA